MSIQLANATTLLFPVLDNRFSSTGADASAGGPERRLALIQGAPLGNN